MVLTLPCFINKPQWLNLASMYRLRFPVATGHVKVQQGRCVCVCVCVCVCAGVGARAHLDPSIRPRPGQALGRVRNQVER